MPVPFCPDVANDAVAVLADSQLASRAPGAAFEMMKARFPELHPVLIAEHLGFARALFRSAAMAAAQVHAGALSRDQASALLKSDHRLFSDQSIELALAYVQASA